MRFPRPCLGGVGSDGLGPCGHTTPLPVMRNCSPALSGGSVCVCGSKAAAFLGEAFLAVFFLGAAFLGAAFFADTFLGAVFLTGFFSLVMHAF